MDDIERLQETIIEDGKLVSEEVRKFMDEDKIGVMLLQGYIAKIWLERNGAESKIRCEMEMAENGKGITFEQLFNPNSLDK